MSCKKEPVPKFPWVDEKGLLTRESTLWLENNLLNNIVQIESDTDGKATLVDAPNAGNILIQNENGNIADSGYSISDLMTSTGIAASVDAVSSFTGYEATTPTSVTTTALETALTSYNTKINELVDKVNEIVSALQNAGLMES